MQRDYFEDANCIGWTREGDGEHKGCAVVISNKEQYENLWKWERNMLVSIFMTH